MNDNHTSEQEESDLRRHFRAMGFWSSLWASIRFFAAVYLIYLADMLLSPHVAPSTRSGFERVYCLLANDMDVMNEGFEEAATLARKSYHRNFGK